ncbi:MAG TPA: mevalonate kinase [Methanobacteriaceae archaeon]|nr:mevalonate kinase [Methanobacteriaceae archaeon]
MSIKAAASAPGKVILFGEHAVVFQKPALAMAVDRRARVKVTKTQKEDIKVHIPDLDVEGTIKADGELEFSGNGEVGILQFIKEALNLLDIKNQIDITVQLDIPIGAGLGSSAAITVATLAAAAKLTGRKLKLEELAQKAHQVELTVQGAASPMDTAVSTYGGLIYLNNGEVLPLNYSKELPLVVAYTSYRGNTGELVTGVRKRRDKYPLVVDPILDSIETVAQLAKAALLEGDEESLGILMNINHGLLDALGVNTPELSWMVYQARKSGALGSKITGAGGGGSIIVYAPGKVKEVLGELKNRENAFTVGISKEGVLLE